MNQLGVINEITQNYLKLFNALNHGFLHYTPNQHAAVGSDLGTLLN